MLPYVCTVAISKFQSPIINVHQAVRIDRGRVLPQKYRRVLKENSQRS